MPLLSYHPPTRLSRPKTRIAVVLAYCFCCVALFILLLYPWHRAMEISGKTGGSSREIGLLNAITITSCFRINPITHARVSEWTEIQPHWLSLIFTITLLSCTAFSFHRLVRCLFPPATPSPTLAPRPRLPILPHHEQSPLHPRPRR